MARQTAREDMRALGHLCPCGLLVAVATLLGHATIVTSAASKVKVSECSGGGSVYSYKYPLLEDEETWVTLGEMFTGRLLLIVNVATF